MTERFAESPFLINIDRLLPGCVVRIRQNRGNMKWFLLLIALLSLRVLNLLKTRFDFGFVSRFLGIEK